MSQGGGCGLFIGSFILGLEGVRLRLRLGLGGGKGVHTLQQLRSVLVGFAQRLRTSFV